MDTRNVVHNIGLNAQGYNVAYNVRYKLLHDIEDVTSNKTQNWFEYSTCMDVSSVCSTCINVSSTSINVSSTSINISSTSINVTSTSINVSNMYSANKIKI